MPKQKPFNLSFSSFFRHNVNGGLLLIIAAILAMIIANSPWGDVFAQIRNYPIFIQIGDFNLFSHRGYPLTLADFINDALMAVFFFHVGLEVKREILVGDLSSPRKAALPVLAAIGGMILPVTVYLLISPANPMSHGAAIPMATDIAFSLGVLGLLGARVPIGLKIFLTALAVVDDIGGILVIAFFYTTDLHLIYLGIAAILLILLCFANWRGICYIWLYILVGIAVWYFFLQSGIHSTIAGVLVAFTIPARPQLKIRKYIDRIRDNIHYFSKSDEESIVLTNDQITSLKNIEGASNKVISPLQHIEDRLHGVVNYFIMPLFAFVSAGIVFKGELSEFFGLVTCAVALGLIFGKFVGIFLFTWLGVKLKIVSLPDGGSWKSIAGIAMLGGIGFTVSLFIANLSFGNMYPELLNQAKLGIILGSVISGVLGYILLKIVLPVPQNSKLPRIDS